MKAGVLFETGIPGIKKEKVLKNKNYCHIELGEV